MLANIIILYYKKHTLDPVFFVGTVPPPGSRPNITLLLLKKLAARTSKIQICAPGRMVNRRSLKPTGFAQIFRARSQSAYIFGEILLHVEI